MVCSANGDADFFTVILGVLQGYSSSPYLSIIYLDFVL